MHLRQGVVQVEEHLDITQPLAQLDGLTQLLANLLRVSSLQVPVDVPLDRQDTHLEIQRPHILSDHLRPGGELERLIVKLAVELGLGEIEHRAGLADPVAELPVGITGLLETLLGNVPVELAGLDISIEEQPIGLKRFQLELGSEDQSLLAEFLGLLQVPNLEIYASHAHKGVSETSRLVGLDLFYLLTVLDLFLEILDRDLVIAQAEAEIAESSEGGIEALKITYPQLHVQAAAEIVDRLVVVTIASVDKTQLVIRPAETGDILLTLAHLQGFVIVPRGSEMISALEIDPS